MDEPTWTPAGWNPPGISTLEVRGAEVARVNCRVDGRGWISTVNRHLRDWQRRPTIIVPSERMAKRYAERWALANLERIHAELPWLVKGMAGIMVREYPTSNPAPPGWR